MGRTRRIRFKQLPDTTWADSETDSSGTGSGSDDETAATTTAAAAAAPPSSTRSTSRGGPVRYLCYFAQSLLDFRIPEFEALAALAGCSAGDLIWEAPRDGHPDSPFRFVTLPSREVARQVASRAILLRVRALGALFGCGGGVMVTRGWL